MKKNLFKTLFASLDLFSNNFTSNVHNAFDVQIIASQDQIKKHFLIFTFIEKCVLIPVYENIENCNKKF